MPTDQAKSDAPNDREIGVDRIVIEQRLYDAWRHGRGCRLTWSDVASLIGDEAIATRISNTAAVQAGVDPPGADCIGQGGETWRQFQTRLSR